MRPIPLTGVSLRDLEYVVALADHLHFGRAADRCAVTQPALSSQIRKLEAQLGVAVFERTNKRVFVTIKGEAIVRQARVVLADARKLLELARSWDAPLSGPLRIGAIATLGPYLFPHLLRPLMIGFPNLDLILSEGHTADLLEDLRRGELDLLLLSLPVDTSGLVVRELFFEPFVLVHPPGHPIALKAPVSLVELDPRDLILLEEGHCLRDQALAFCSLGSGEIRRHAASLETLRHMIAAGAGYSLIPALAREDHGVLDGLVDYTALDDGVGRTVAVLWRDSEPRTDDLETLAGFFRRIAPATVRCIDPSCRDGLASTGPGPAVRFLNAALPTRRSRSPGR